MKGGGGRGVYLPRSARDQGVRSERCVFSQGLTAKVSHFLLNREEESPRHLGFPRPARNVPRAGSGDRGPEVDSEKRRPDLHRGDPTPPRDFSAHRTPQAGVRGGGVGFRFWPGKPAWESGGRFRGPLWVSATHRKPGSAWLACFFPARKTLPWRLAGSRCR